MHLRSTGRLAKLAVQAKGVRHKLCLAYQAGELKNGPLALVQEHYGLLSPILHLVPLQLMAYHVALVKGTDVDKRRNLAKSVTVE